MVLADGAEVALATIGGAPLSSDMVALLVALLLFLAECTLPSFDLM